MEIVVIVIFASLWVCSELKRIKLEEEKIDLMLKNASLEKSLKTVNELEEAKIAEGAVADFLRKKAPRLSKIISETEK